MTLNELLDVIDPHRDSESEKIQICAPNSWEDFDEVSTRSLLLIWIGGAKVKQIGAIDEGVIRVEIEWNTRPYAERKSIKERRIDLGISQKELAEAAGMRQQQLSGYERGIRRPSSRTLRKLAVALGCSPEELCTNDEEDKTNE